jgi:predicted dehydrogenase
MSARKTALLGFGNVAEKGHLPAWRQRRDFEIVAVADTSAERRALAAELLPGVRVYEDCDDLLDREYVDVVDIATPPASHASLVVRSAAAGCHVLCEKPLATSVEELAILKDAVRKSGVVLNTVHNWKYSAQFHRVAALLAEGAIGRLLSARFDIVRNGHAAAAGEESWRSDATIAGGGILVDHGWHLLYLLLDVCGRAPQWIRASVYRRRYVSSDVEDTASCFLDFGSLSGEIHLTWAGPERRTSWRFRGTDGTLTLDERWLVLERGGELFRFEFPQSLSNGSNHPDWFDAVIESFLREIEEPALRGRNLAEAEQCLILTTLAYESAACNGLPLGVPDISRPELPAACR